MPRLREKPKPAARKPVVRPYCAPSVFATHILGLTPDPAQSGLLDASPHRLILNCSRQWGKSTITAVKAVHQAYYHPNSLILAVSPSARQSAEFLRKASAFLHKLEIRPRGDGDNEMSLLFPNGSRIVGLPGVEDTIRCFSSVNLLLIDEASRVEDDLFHAVNPMLAASNGSLWLISTPNGRQGFFYDCWTQQGAGWTKIAIPATDCPRISPDFLAWERRIMPLRKFQQEYLCQFNDHEDAWFTVDVIRRAFHPITPILHPYACVHPSSRVYLAADLGQVLNYTAIAILERARVICGPRDLATYEFPCEDTYTIRHLERLPLGTPYPSIVEHIRTLTAHPNLGDSRHLVVDATGVGRPVVDLLRQSRLSCRLTPVTITSGDHAYQARDTWHVPRQELLTKLEIALQQGQLRISNALPAAEQLADELQNLRRARGAGHDDLVFATALAYWRATLF